MIANPERTTLVSSLGWVDHDALWVFDVPTARIEQRALGSGAQYLALHSSGSPLFTVAHHFTGERFDVSVHSFSEPGRAVALAGVSAQKTVFTGDASLWESVPLIYVAYLKDPWNDYSLVRIQPLTGTIEIQRLEWYDQTYDKDYQAVIDVVELPWGDAALVSVQRSSRLVLHDLATGKQTGKVDLAGRGGNPALESRRGGEEIWATDYDTIAVIRASDLRVVRRRRLQSSALGTQQFIGNYSFAPDEDICVVARPFSGDVVGIDGATLRIKRVAKLGRQPFEVAALHDGAVVARDWKTGDLLRGTLEKRGWFGR